MSHSNVTNITTCELNVKRELTIVEVSVNELVEFVLS